MMTTEDEFRVEQEGWTQLRRRQCIVIPLIILALTPLVAYGLALSQQRQKQVDALRAEVSQSDGAAVTVAEEKRAQARTIRELCESGAIEQDDTGEAVCNEAEKAAKEEPAETVAQAKDGRGPEAYVARLARLAVMVRMVLMARPVATATLALTASRSPALPASPDRLAPMGMTQRSPTPAATLAMTGRTVRPARPARTPPRPARRATQAPLARLASTAHPARTPLPLALLGQLVRRVTAAVPVAASPTPSAAPMADGTSPTPRAR